jgi:predicted RND superfamily exporter protein
MPYAYTFLSWETFRIIKKELFQSVGLCLAAVFVIALALLAHPLTAVLVFLVVVMTVVDILGCMNMWGLAIDNVSVIQLVISVGLCIDYAAHVGHNFMLHQGSRSQRVVATLGDVGSAVMCGGISTFLGVMLLSLSKSYVFRVLFQTFFLTVILGLGHGLILLPALLAIFGPEPYQGSTTAVEDITASKVSDKGPAVDQAAANAESTVSDKGPAGDQAVTDAKVLGA